MQNLQWKPVRRQVTFYRINNEICDLPPCFLPCSHSFLQIHILLSVILISNTYFHLSASKHSSLDRIFWTENIETEGELFSAKCASITLMHVLLP